VSMVAPGFAGAANFGGFAAPGLVGFGSFYLASPQEHSGSANPAWAWTRQPGYGLPCMACAPTIQKQI